VSRETATTPPAPQHPLQRTVVQDAAAAQQQLTAAKAVKAKAEMQLKSAGRTVLFHRIRLWSAKLGMPAWVTGLIVGSVAALALAIALIFLFGVGLAPLFAGVLVAYVLCGVAVFWCLRTLSGENDENLIQVRSERLRLADENHRVAISVLREKTAIVNNWDQLCRSLQQALNSEAYKYQMETDRLLSIDPGRLYPDEFEKFVGQVFRHLGFTVEVTGQSGDQGVDVLAYKGSLRLAIQAKRYIGAVGNSAVQEVYAGMAHHGCHRCVVVASSGFTTGAIELAQSTGCLLIGTDKVASLIRGEIPLA
jgi:restriction system protein